MSLLDLLGTGKSIDQAHEAVSQVVQQLDPLFQTIENRLEGIISTNLDRLNGLKITIPQIEITVSLPSEPKALPVNPAPD